MTTKLQSGALYAFFLLIILTSVNAQTVPPWATPPKWRFGKCSPSFNGENQGVAGINFMNVGFAPTQLPLGALDDDAATAEEGGSTMVDTLGNIAFYTVNGQRVYNGANAAVVNPAAGHYSSTQGAVSFPDPADPANQYYLVLAACELGGNGLYYYRLRVPVGTTTVTVLSQGQLEARPNVTESVTVSSNGDASQYYIIAHATNTNTYYSWPVTGGAGSGIGARQNFNGTINGSTNQGSLKISRCQDRIGFVAHGKGVEVYNWNRTTGTLGSYICHKAFLTDADFPTDGIWYGAEFSPDGSKFYISNLSGGRLLQLNTASNVLTALAATPNTVGGSIGTMQLGPDGKIYVLRGVSGGRGGATAYLGVINDPDRAGNGGPGVGCNYVNNGYAYATGGAHYPFALNGVANQGWTNPNQPNIYNNSCPTVNFGYDFKDYYRRNIDTTSVSWNFGDGGLSRGPNPSHQYAVNNTYTVTLTVKDKQCNYDWVRTKNITIGCILPVSWLYVNAVPQGKNVLVTWGTATEENNDYFSIQRSSDGVTFETIGYVKGVGNSSSDSYYKFEDESPLQGVSYYRVLQHDIDKAFTSSEIVTVTMDMLVQVAPNPSSHNFTLKLDNASNAVISVTDVPGKEIYHRTLTQENEVSFGSDWPSGTYFLKIYCNGKSVSVKLVKQ